MPFVRGPDEIADLPAFLGRAGEAARPFPPRHAHLRRDRRCADAFDRSAAREGARACERRRRRHRSRLPAGNAVSAAWRGGAGTEGARAFPSASIPPISDELEGRRAGRRGLSAQPRRRHAAAGLRSCRDAGADPVRPRRSRFARPRHRSCRRRPASPSSPIPFSIRSISASPQSIGRFIEARRRWPEVELLMGTGNLTELTDADSSGVTAILAGLCSELRIRNVLTVNVSPHTVRTVEEHDLARRILFAARNDGALPRGYHPGLLQIHDRKPFPAPGRGYRGAGGRGARRQFPHRDRRGRHPYLQQQGPCGREGRFRTLCRARRRERRRARLLSRRRTDEGRDRLAARQALCAGRAAGLGRGGSGARDRPHAPCRSRPHAARRRKR